MPSISRLTASYNIADTRTKNRLVDAHGKHFQPSFLGPLSRKSYVEYPEWDGVHGGYCTPNESRKRPAMFPSSDLHFRTSPRMFDQRKTWLQLDFKVVPKRCGSRCNTGPATLYSTVLCHLVER